MRDFHQKFLNPKNNFGVKRNNFYRKLVVAQTPLSWTSPGDNLKQWTKGQGPISIEAHSHWNILGLSY